MTERITSLKDERIQLAKSINSLKGRIEKRKFLIEGSEALHWAIKAGIQIDFVLKSDKRTDFEVNEVNCRIYDISEGLLKKVTATNYVVPVVGVGNIKREKLNTNFCLVLDDVRDFGNIGTIIRSCHAFGVNNIMSTKEKFDLFQKKTVDASRGCVFKTNLRTFSSPETTLDFLKHRGFQIITTSPRGAQLQSMLKLDNRPIALVVGNETTGVSNELMENADMTVQIPLNSAIESLNVGVSTGISIYELKLKQILGMIEKHIKSTLGREMNVAAMLMKKTLDTELKKVSSLSSTQLVFLMVLKCDQKMSGMDAQRQFGIPDKEVMGFFDPLLEEGLIRGRINDRFTISEKGVETIAKLWTTIENTEKEILSDFTEAEAQELRRLLEKIKQKCETMIEST